MDKTYIGIDMGTSGIKLLLIDASRQTLAQSSQEYEVAHPRAGWSQIDPQIWYDAMMAGLKRLLAGQDGRQVGAIGVTGQMHTVVLLDEAGQSVRPALMWNDKRTGDCIPVLRRTLAQGPDGAYLSGIVSTGSPAANLYWMSREEPDLFRRVRRFLIGPDYLVYRLTGQAGTDYVEASTSSLYSPTRRAWLDDMRTLIGLPEAAYPEVRGSGEVVGCVLSDIAVALGLGPDVRVIAGTGDNPATAISTGCLGGGYPVLSLGTSGVLMFPTPDLRADAKGKTILCSLDGRRFSYLVQGVVQSTGESINWWTRKVLGARDFGAMDGAITDAMIRESRVLFYPHINGDKTLYADPTLRGAFIGLSSDTGPEGMYYAVLEGLCLAFRQLAEGMHLDLSALPVLKVVGGGAKSDLWLQTLANVLNVRVERLSGAVGPAFGIALLACAADHPDVRPESLTAGSLAIAKGFDPDPGLTALYRERYARYLRIHDALRYVDTGESPS